ncbi:MAG: tetratricopeptide repeat protein [Cyanobacteria bacterium P01_F01_bin.56]
MAWLITILIFSFWAWMFYDCFQSERGCCRWGWLLILSFSNVLGAIAYSLFRYLPRLFLVKNPIAHRQRLRHQLHLALLEVRKGGTPQKFVLLGHLYQELGHKAHALAVYQRALRREPRNLLALWNCANIELDNQNLVEACLYLQNLMGLDFTFKEGKASLKYAQVLFELGDFNMAQQHLEKHLQNWQNPEAAFILAKIKARQQNLEEACQVIEVMLRNMQTSSRFHYCKYRQHIAQGKQLLKRLKSIA